MTDLENIDVVHTLADTFRETGDSHYLDTAIALTEEIISTSSPVDISKILQPLLDSLFEVAARVASASGPAQDLWVARRRVIVPRVMSKVHDSATDTVSSTGVIESRFEEEIHAIRMLYDAFRETGDIDYLHNAIAIMEEVISRNCPTTVKTLFQPILAELLRTRCRIESINAGTAPATPQRGNDIAMYNTLFLARSFLDDLSVVRTLEETFLEYGDCDYLDNAIALTEEIISVGFPTEVRSLLQPVLTSLLEMKSQPKSPTTRRADDSPASERSIESVSSPEPNELLALVQTFGEMLFKAHGNFRYLDDAIRVILESAIENKPCGSLQTLLSRLFEMMSVASPVGGTAAGVPVGGVGGRPGAGVPNPVHGPIQIMHIAMLLFSLLARFDSTGDIEFVNGAIGIGERFLEECPARSTFRSSVLILLSTSLRKRFFNERGEIGLEELGRRFKMEPVVTVTDTTVVSPAVDLDRAIELLFEVLAATPSGGGLRAQALHTLIPLLLRRYLERAVLEDLGDVILAMEEEKIGTTPANIAEAQAVWSPKLAKTKRAIPITSKCSAVIVPDDPGPAHQLNSLLLRCKDRFRRSAMILDQDDAILALEQAAVKALVPDSALLSNLGGLLYLRSVQFGDLTDVERAVARTNEGLAETSLDDPERPDRLLNSSDTLLLRF